MIDLDELERLSTQVTPLSWRIADKGSHLFVTDSNPNRHIAKISRIPRASAENAEYIVAACNAVPELIARIREFETTSLTTTYNEILQLHVHFMGSWGLDRYATAVKLANHIPDLILENARLKKQVLELEKADKRENND